MSIMYPDGFYIVFICINSVAVDVSTTRVKEFTAFQETAQNAINTLNASAQIEAADFSEDLGVLSVTGSDNYDDFDAETWANGPITSLPTRFLLYRLNLEHSELANQFAQALHAAYA